MADNKEPAVAMAMDVAVAAAVVDAVAAPDAGSNRVVFTKWRANVLDRLELEEARIEQAFQDACKLRADGLRLIKNSRSMVDHATMEFLLEGSTKLPDI